jgi:hypothetical protein
MGVCDTAAAGRVHWTSTRGINSMKHLLTGVGMVAALALSAAPWAQPTSPGGNAVGMPGYRIQLLAGDRMWQRWRTRQVKQIMAL